MGGQLILGTSGFSYGHWRNRFYPPGTPQSRWLEVYSERFSAVELNVTFYRLPTRDTFEDWARRTPEDFHFVVKGSRLITHYRRLRNAEDPLDALLHEASALGQKLSVLLWQLPPRSMPDVPTLDRFCDALEYRSGRGRGTRRLRHAFEFRDERWFSDEVLGVLRRHGHALVWADPPRDGQRNEDTADFRYLRFHHGPRPDGGYGRSELEPHAATASSAIERGQDVYAFFNNDPGAWAPRNALEFGELMAERGVTVRASRIHSGALSQ